MEDTWKLSHNLNIYNCCHIYIEANRTTGCLAKKGICNTNSNIWWTNFPRDVRKKNVLVLIHIDICGPFHVPLWNGQPFFLSFIYDYSRYGYLYLIHEKSQTLDVFKSYKAEVELQINKRIKLVRSNCGGEYYGRYDG